jgi:hypothetical protein
LEADYLHLQVIGCHDTDIVFIVVVVVVVIVISDNGREKTQDLLNARLVR